MSDNENENNNENQNNFDPERFSNFQKEMDRKFSNQNQQIEALLKSQQDLMTTLSQPKKQEKSSINNDISDLIYTDPAKYAEIIEERAAKKAAETISTQNSVASKNQAKAQEVLVKLTQDYPELSDVNSQLSKKALEAFNNMSDEEKSNSALAYKSAILEAVGDLGIKKASQRKSKDSDVDYGDFVLSGSSNNSSRRDKKPKLDAATVAFAEQMGLDIEDKNVLKRLAGHSQRDYGKYR